MPVSAGAGSDDGALDDQRPDQKPDDLIEVRSGLDGRKAEHLSRSLQ